MTVYTVSSCDEHPKFGDNRCTIGSYTTRGRALDECVGYIMERLRVRDDLAFCMANDENHPEAKEFFSGRDSRSDSWRVKRGKMTALREFLRDKLAGDGCYYACLDAGMGWISFHFDVDENDVEGDLWHTVTWGDSDCEDPEFTTPYPETFTSQETAVETFVGYVKDLYKSHCMKWSDEFIRNVRKSLVEDGKVQVDLNDGCCVSCVLYHDDAKNIKE
jgi:hypothetical protein